jgi:ribonuclease P protein component
VLDRAHRLTHPRDFTRVSRRGRRKAGTFVVCHAAARESKPAESTQESRFGFVVSKAVGNAPTRNRVKRQLREIAREIMTDPLGDVVIRVLPRANEASWPELRAEVRSLLGIRSA